MKIVHFSTEDIRGGAAKGAYRLHQAIRHAGHFSQMAVRRKWSHDPDVHRAGYNPWRTTWRRLRRRLPGLRPDRASFTFNHDLDQGIDLAPLLARLPTEVDLVCLHWVTDFLTTRDIHRLAHWFNAPLAWVLMDQEPVTGGCHYAFGCQRFQQQCGHCPLLAHSGPRDRSHVVWQNKRRWLSDLPIVFVAGNRWAAQRVAESSLFGGHRVASIPLAIDIDTFRPSDRRAARSRLGLPNNKRLVFFGATDLTEPRKGGAVLVEALHHLAARLRDPRWRLAPEEVALVVAGRQSQRLLDGVPLAWHDLGFLDGDEALAAAYQAADVFVCPSLEDAGPLMLSEAMLCGTPVVAFPTGGAPDLIDSGATGYLAAPRDPADFAHGILTVLASQQPGELAKAARRRAAERHAPHRVAQQYLELATTLRHQPAGLRRCA
jgi:glycosyltransferase involved in cell wall biosynthesis